MTGPGTRSLLVGDASYVARVTERDGVCVVDVDGETYEIAVEEQTRWTIRTHGGADTGAQGQTLTAPLPGRISDYYSRQTAPAQRPPGRREDGAR